MRRLDFIREELARRALDVCQTYLPNGRRQGQYWVVGDIDGNPGRSLYVRLSGRAGKWTDGATGEHGDCLDIIAHARHIHSFTETLAEAERFLSLPPPAIELQPWALPPSDRSETARRLYGAAHPIHGTLAHAYLEARGLIVFGNDPLRFHPRCYARSGSGERIDYPALLAAITDMQGHITGVHRTWLSLATKLKAPIDNPRRSLGRMIGHGVRFGHAGPAMIAGEGLETVLALRTILPWIPSIAALTATHLGLLQLPTAVQRLYIARDNDPAGHSAWSALSTKALTHGIAPYPLIPQRNDWNDDLLAYGPAPAYALAKAQLQPIDQDSPLALGA